MDERPPRQQDPLALAFFGVAFVLLASLLLYVFFFKTPEPATPARAFDFGEVLRHEMARLTERFRDKTPAKPASKAAPPPVAVASAGIEVGRTWRYAVGHPSHANTRFPGFFMHPRGSSRIVAELAEYR